MSEPTSFEPPPDDESTPDKTINEKAPRSSKGLSKPTTRKETSVGGDATMIEGERKRSAEPEGTVYSEAEPPEEEHPDREVATPVPAGVEVVDSHIMVDGTGGEQSPLVGRTLGGCRILDRLGEGAMGAVYKANQLSLDRVVAVKTIKPELVHDDHLLQRFRREAKTVGRFNTPHVVQIHEVGVEDGLHFLIMEFIAGGSLHDYVVDREGQRLNVEDSILFLEEACRGLLEAERLEIVHRDVKPENLLLDHGGHIKIADFGVAKSLGATVEMTMTGAVIGTPLYMSPEQCSGDELDHRSDMYSLGATFCHLMTGTPPFKGESVYEVIKRKTEAVSLSPRNITNDASVPGPLNNLIERMTQLDPVDRYASFQEVLDDLMRLRMGEKILPPPPPSRPRHRRRSGVGVWVGAALLAAAAGGLFIAQQQGWLERGKTNAIPIATTAATAGDIRSLLAILRTDFMRENPPNDLAKRGDELLARLGGDLQASDSAEELAQLVRDARQFETFRDYERSKTRPTVALPFDSVETYWKGFRAEVDKVEAGGPELKHQMDRSLEQTRGSLLQQCEAGLRTVVEDLERRFNVADGFTPSVVDVQDLDRQLKLAADGQVVLQRTFADWQAMLSGSTLDGYRGRLREWQQDQARSNGGTVALTHVDFLTKMQDMRTQLRTQPSLELETRAKNLQAQADSSWSEDAGLSALIKDIEVGRFRDKKNSDFEPDFAMPFESLLEQWARFQLAMTPSQEAGEELTEFLQNQMDSRSSALFLETLGALRSFKADFWAPALSKLDGGEWTAAQVADLHATAVAARVNFEMLFPDRLAEFDQLLLLEDLERLDIELRQYRAQQEKVEAIEGEIAKLMAMLEQDTPWGATERKTSQALLDSITEQSEPLGTLVGATNRPLRELVEEVTGRRDLREEFYRTSREVARLLEDGDFVGVNDSLPRLRDSEYGGTLVTTLESSLGHVEAAFGALFRELDLADARKSLEEAQKVLAGNSETRDFTIVRRSLETLAALGTIAHNGMTPIGAGDIQLPGQDKKSVPAFFVDNREVSIEEFVRFQSEIKGLSMQERQDLLPEGEGAGVSADVWESHLELLDRPPVYLEKEEIELPHRNQWPIEQVNYYQALAYNGILDKDLPTLEEWWLVARGSLSRRPYHRTFTFSNQDNDSLANIGSDEIHIDNKQPRNVDDRATCLDHPAVHHLMGNVSEWLRAAPDDSEAPTIGGSYQTSKMRPAVVSGDQVVRLLKRQSRKSNGFRAILRPRDFFRRSGLDPRF